MTLKILNGYDALHSLSVKNGNKHNTKSGWIIPTGFCVVLAVTMIEISTHMLISHKFM